MNTIITQPGVLFRVLLVSMLMMKVAFNVVAVWQPSFSDGRHYIRLTAATDTHG